jgi:hypothetical protein
MRWFRRWYGANPLHLLAMLGCVLLADYAAVRLLHVKPIGIALWLVGAVVGHDLVLFPLYVIADRSVMAVFRHRPPDLPAVPWINYLRVPVVLSGILLLIWFPLIFRIPSHFPRTTDLSLNPYLGHWVAITGVLFLLSAAAFALRLRPGNRRRRAADLMPDAADDGRDTVDRGRRAANHLRDTGGHPRDTGGLLRDTGGQRRMTGPQGQAPPWEVQAPPWEGQWEERRGADLR